MPSSPVAPRPANARERAGRRSDIHVQSPFSAAPSRRQSRPSVLAWSAWQRAAALSPVLLLLWLAVAWATAQVAPL